MINIKKVKQIIHKLNHLENLIKNMDKKGGYKKKKKKTKRKKKRRKKKSRRMRSKNKNKIIYLTI